MMPRCRRSTNSMRRWKSPRFSGTKPSLLRGQSDPGDPRELLNRHCGDQLRRALHEGKRVWILWSAVSPWLHRWRTHLRCRHREQIQTRSRSLGSDRPEPVRDPPTGPGLVSGWPRPLHEDAPKLPKRQPTLPAPSGTSLRSPARRRPPSIHRGNAVAYRLGRRGRCAGIGVENIQGDAPLLPLVRLQPHPRSPLRLLGDLRNARALSKVDSSNAIAVPKLSVLKPTAQLSDVDTEVL